MILQYDLLCNNSTWVRLTHKASAGHAMSLLLSAAHQAWQLDDLSTSPGGVGVRFTAFLTEQSKTPCNGTSLLTLQHTSNPQSLVCLYRKWPCTLLGNREACRLLGTYSFNMRHAAMLSKAINEAPRELPKSQLVTLHGKSRAGVWIPEFWQQDLHLPCPAVTSSSAIQPNKQERQMSQRACKNGRLVCLA